MSQWSTETRVERTGNKVFIQLQKDKTSVFQQAVAFFFSNSLSNQQRRPSINVVRCSFEVNGSCLNLGSKKKSDICSSLKKQKLRSSETPELWSFGAWARSSEARRLRLGRALPVEFSLKLYGKETKKKKCPTTCYPKRCLPFFSVVPFFGFSYQKWKDASTRAAEHRRGCVNENLVWTEPFPSFFKVGWNGKAKIHKRSIVPTTQN